MKGTYIIQIKSNRVKVHNNINQINGEGHIDNTSEINGE